MFHGDIQGRLEGRFSYEPPYRIHTYADQNMVPYTGDTALFGFTKDVAIEYDGTSLTATSPDTNYHFLQSESGLDNYPSMADEWSVFVRTSDVANAGVSEVHFHDGYADGIDYFARIDWNDDIEIYAFDGTTQLAGNTSPAMTLEDHIWYELGVQWDDGEAFGGEYGNMRVYLKDFDGTLLREAMINEPTKMGVDEPHWRVNFSADAPGVTYYWDDAGLIAKNDPITSGLVTSFEEGLTAFEGDLTTFDTSTAAAYDGTRSLHASYSKTPNRIYSTSGLNLYPERGDVFECYFRITGSGGTTVSDFEWGLQGPNDHYRFEIDWGNTNLYLTRLSGGSETHLDFDSTMTVNANSWYRLTVTWDDGTLGNTIGTITCRLEDLGSGYSDTLSGRDTTWASGGIGFRKDSYDTNKHHYWDYVNIV